MAKISSKKLIERIEHLKEIEYSSCRGYDEKYEKALNDVVDIIHTLNAETAVKKSKKVKHGKWEGGYCSVCNEHCTYYLTGDAWVDVDENANYCPNCGAKMDLKE